MTSVASQHVPDEVRTVIRELTVNPLSRDKLGSLLAEAGRKAGLTDDELTAFESARDSSPARTANLD